MIKKLLIITRATTAAATTAASRICIAASPFGCSFPLLRFLLPPLLPCFLFPFFQGMQYLHHGFSLAPHLGFHPFYLRFNISLHESLLKLQLLLQLLLLRLLLCLLLSLLLHLHHQEHRHHR